MGDAVVIFSAPSSHCSQDEKLQNFDQVMFI
jgi:hypothetical protein